MANGGQNCIRRFRTYSCRDNWGEGKGLSERSGEIGVELPRREGNNTVYGVLYVLREYAGGLPSVQREL